MLSMTNIIIVILCSLSELNPARTSKKTTTKQRAKPQLKVPKQSKKQDSVYCYWFTLRQLQCTYIYKSFFLRVLCVLLWFNLALALVYGNIIMKTQQNKTLNQSGWKPSYSENEIWKVVEKIEATQFAFVHKINWLYTVLG